jgi:hypothetical protein
MFTSRAPDSDPDMIMGRFGSDPTLEIDYRKSPVSSTDLTPILVLTY